MTTPEEKENERCVCGGMVKDATIKASHSPTRCVVDENGAERIAALTSEIASLKEENERLRGERDAARDGKSQLHRRVQAAEAETLKLRKELEQRKVVDPWASDKRQAEAVERDEMAAVIERAERPPADIEEK